MKRLVLLAVSPCVAVVGSCLGVFTVGLRQQGARCERRISSSPSNLGMQKNTNQQRRPSLKPGSHSRWRRSPFRRRVLPTPGHSGTARGIPLTKNTRGVCRSARAGIYHVTQAEMQLEFREGRGCPLRDAFRLRRRGARSLSKSPPTKRRVPKSLLPKIDWTYMIQQSGDQPILIIWSIESGSTSRLTRGRAAGPSTASTVVRSGEPSGARAGRTTAGIARVRVL